MLLIAASLLIFSHSAWAEWRNRQAETWPTVPAKIITSELKHNSSLKGGHVYRPLVYYSYTVAGVTYLTSRVSFGPPGMDDLLAAESITADYNVGVPAIAYIDPKDPNIAILKPGPIPGGHEGDITLGLILIGAGLIFCFIRKKNHLL